MSKIKMIRFATDEKNGKPYNIDDVLDLGEQRNKRAVTAGLAVWVDASDFKEIRKEVEAETEKKEVTPKKTTTSARGKKIETK